MSRKILFLIPYPLHASPSQRFRFEQYLSILSRNDYEYKIQSFLSDNLPLLGVQKSNAIFTAWRLISGFAKRFAILFQLYTFDYIFIHREAAPVGPPVIEWIITKVFKRKLIYDFDDAIWHTDRINEPFWIKWIKCRSKVAKVCSWSYKVSCGNQYLCDYARQFNACVVLNPTTIDTGLHKPNGSKQKYLNTITIGWTGSYSTVKYLSQIEGVIQQLEKEYPSLRFLVIADLKPELQLNSLDFIAWNTHTEIDDLNQMDIGIMPLPDDEWAKGKCGFKALQYMALQIPSVVSPVGVNTLIVEHGVNGYLAANADDWLRYLKLLIEDEGLRKKIGEAAQRTVVEHYSVSSNFSTFLSLFA